MVCPRSVVSPGLINAHDHISFQANPAMTTTERYEHRHDWRVGNDGHTRVNNGGNATNLQMRWAEVRQIMAGTTSIVGATYNAGNAGLMRNLDTTPTGQLGNLTGSSGIDSDTFPLNDNSGLELTSGCNYPALPLTVPTAAGTAYIPHVAEGIEASAHNEFVCLTQNNGVGVLSPRTGFVHGIGLKAHDIALMSSTGSSLVWSPRSNVSLYGDTASINLYKSLGVNIALGTDWTISGSMNILRELQCAEGLNANYFGNKLSDEDLWKMVTANGAAATATTQHIGRLLPGRLADIAIFKRQGSNFFRSIIDAQPEDVVLTMRGGRFMYGDANVIAQSGTASCDAISVCGAQKSVCITGDVSVLTGANAGTSLALLQQGNTTTYPLFFCGVTPTNEPTCVPERPVTTLGPGTNSHNGSTLYSSASTDTDKDGIPDAMDNCPGVFNPVRPMDNGVQPDVDNDGVGDVCDVCPLNPGSTCAPFDPNDRDSDLVPNATDNCPNHYNPMQEDVDGDGKGDVCDPCPTLPNPGAQACPVTIYDIKRGVAPTGTPVALPNVLVTASGAGGFYLQVSPSDPVYDGGSYSGLFVYAPSNGLVAGDRVDIPSGTPANFFGQRQLSNVGALGTDGGMVRLSQGNPLPVPAVIPASTWSTAAAAEPLESVLVRVADVTVLSHNPDAGPGDANPTNEFVVTGDLYVNDYLYAASPLPVVGTYFQSLTGVFEYRNNRYKLNVRGPSDLVTGPPTLAGLTPATAFLFEGESQTFPEPVLVHLSGLAQGDTAVVVTSSTPAVQVGDGGLVIVPDGQQQAAVPLTGMTSTSGSFITLTAQLGADSRTAQLRVIGPSDQPQLSGISPATATVNVGGSQSFTLTLDAPVAIATDVTLSLVPNTFGTAPMMVTVPQNALTVSFTAQIDAQVMNNATGTLTASLNGSQVSSTLTARTEVLATELFISEYGEAGVGNNKYVEVFNGTGAAVDLTGYVLKNNANGNLAGANQTYALSGVINHGEALVFCNSSIDLSLRNTCAGLTTALTHNGNDAISLERNSTTIDVVGTVGMNPGTGWAVCGTANATVDHVLLRKPQVTSPTTAWATSAGTNLMDCQWELRSAATLADVQNNNTMGQHTLSP